MQQPAEFLAAVRAAGAMNPEALMSLETWARATKADTPTIAKYLHDGKWLTPYQIQRIHAGKGNKLTVGHYLLIDILGEGSMGRVFRARHTRLAREMALKVIRKDKLSNPRVLERFRQEVRAVGQLVHPNIVLAIDADTVGQVHYVAMELIDGNDLKSLVTKHGPMPMHVACEYIRQAALGLQHAFEQKLVHRDVKPSNLMVTRHGVVKVLDMGLAMLNDDESIEKRGTLEGMVLGTPDFLAPEQAKDAARVDTRADIYALGGTLYFLLTGHVPFEEKTMTAKLMQHATEPPPRLRKYRQDLPPQLDELILKMLAKQPETRPQTPLQVAALLQPFCMPQQAAPPPTEPTNSQMFGISDDAPQRVIKREGSLLTTIAALAALAIAVILAVVFLKKVKF